MSAMTMAIFLNGMGRDEIRDLTLAMVASGERLDFSGPRQDDHRQALDRGCRGQDHTAARSAGRVLRGAVPQLSGRGLGHTGGTLDKLESIPGWRAS